MSKDFSKRLVESIEKKGITASELSRLSGVGKSDISHYMKGRYTPKQDKCYPLAKALGVDPGWLMTGVEPSTENLSEEDDQALNDLLDLLVKLTPKNRGLAKKILLNLIEEENE